MAEPPRTSQPASGAAFWVWAQNMPRQAVRREGAPTYRR